MRELTVMYVRDLDGNESVELVIWLYEQVLVSWSPLHTDLLDAFRAGSGMLSAVLGSPVATILQGSIPGLFDPDLVVSMIPQSIPAGSAFPRSSILQSHEVDYWTAEHDYLFVEGLTHPMVLPQITASWDLTLNGSILVGIMLTYCKSSLPQNPTAFDPSLYNSPYIARNNQAGISVYVPKPERWSTSDYVIAGFVTSPGGGGSWHMLETWCRSSFLWCYPPVFESWDMRLLANNERLQVGGTYWDLTLSDNGEPSDPLWGGDFSWLPDPVASGVVRQYLPGSNKLDIITVRSSDYPVRFRPTFSRPSGVVPVGDFPLPLISLILPHLRLGGLGGGASTGGGLLTIADKLLTVGGLAVNIRRTKQDG